MRYNYTQWCHYCLIKYYGSKYNGMQPKYMSIKFVYKVVCMLYIVEHLVMIDNCE